jgi:formylmethanofuran dehydrogenase subunit E
MIDQEASSSISKELLETSVAFHGHLGAFLILGLKAGLLANEILGKHHFETSVVVETQPFPPCSCFVDGVQVATGCTMGKGNIRLEKGDLLMATFKKGNHRLRLKLKSDILKDLLKVSSKKESMEAALKLVGVPAQALFDVET